MSDDWIVEEQYWRTNWNTRPYVSADRGFDYYRPGDKNGVESGNRYRAETEMILRATFAPAANVSRRADSGRGTT